MRRGSRRRGAGALLLAGVVACGARSGFSDGDPLADFVAPPHDAGGLAAVGAQEAPDATATYADATIPGDVEVEDAATDAAPGDATTTDAPGDAKIEGGPDAESDAPVDAPFDASPVGCPFTGLLAASGPDVDQIALDDDSVYFHDANGISRVPKTGGAATLVAATKLMDWPDYSAFALGETSLFWWQWNGAQGSTTISTTPKQGGAAATLAIVGGDQYFGLLDHAGSLDLWTGNTPDLTRVAPDGGVVDVSGLLPTYTSAAVVDGDAIFFGAEGALYRFEAGTLTLVANLEGVYVGNLAVDADTVYVSGELPLNGGVTLEAIVVSVPKTGGTPSTLFARTGAYTWLAFDDPYVYMTDRFGGEVLRMVKNGSDQTTVVQIAAMEILDLAVDDSCVYWTGGKGTTNGVYVAPR